MKYLSIVIAALILVSCGQKVAFTSQLKEEYNLTEANMKKVQFYNSSTIILMRRNTVGSQTTNDGVLVTNQSSEQDRIIIPANTKCVFDSYGEDGEVVIRFEVGSGRVLKFAVRQQQTTGKYYLIAKWGDKGGELTYGNVVYNIDSTSGNAYLMVVLKKLNKTKRKDRLVKGMRV
jgi:hypothetical protein